MEVCIVYVEPALPAAAAAENRCEKASILGKRRRHLGPNLALFFEDDPLHIVRGQGCEIFDAEVCQQQTRE